MADEQVKASKHAGLRNKNGKGGQEWKKQKHKGHGIHKEHKEMEDVKEKCSEEIEWQKLNKFDEFPVSSKTLKGLDKAKYTSPTEIQREGIILALRGCDVLGAAKTGSGKTLAFLIPILELLWKEKFTSMDGLGALVISPTRELAYQTFEVLRKVGKFHNFSAGLIIGGKDMAEEQSRILDTNIIVCTPGRLLQHMDETPNFDCSNLKILVLDEADRILDLGFQQAMNAIIDNLPEERQTLLYSATQTKSVKDLARLSLKDPSYVSVHEKAKFITPKKLEQYYVVCELQDKMNFLYSFIKNHLKSKVIVFMSSCKQVKFFYEVFRRLRPGNPLMALYGKQKQLKRVGIYEEFCRKSNAVLFATDIAARGLDFPEVHWVVQFDCPEDSSTYVHRVGRTARLEKDGQALLVLLPSEEEEMIKELEKKKVPIQQIRPDPKKLQSIQKKLASYCAQSQEVKHWAQRSIVSYARSVFLQSNKKIFDVHKLPIKDYATSIGLPVPPRIRFMKKLEKQIGSAAKDAERDEVVKKSIKGKNLGNTEESERSESEDENQHDNGKEKKNNILKMKIYSNANDDDDDILVLKKKHFHDEASDDDIKIDELVESPSKDSRKQKTRKETKATLAKKMMHKGIKMNTKIVFDDDGEMAQVEEPTMSSDKSDNNDDDDDDDSSDVTHRLKPVDIKDIRKKEVGGINIKNMRRKLGKEDKMDRQTERERIKRKHKEIKLKKRKERQAETGMDVVTIGTADGLQESDAEELSENEQEEVSRKNSPKKKRKMEQEEEDETSDNDNLQDDEELALQLISGLH